MSVDKRSARFGTGLRKMLSLGVAFAAALTVNTAWADSKARIVRLSEVQGTVQMDRAAGDKFSKAFINLPVIEGSRVRTGGDGRAEVEFEDGSTLRLTPGTEVDFARLTLGDDGNKLNTVVLVSGTVYANVHAKKAHDKNGDQFVVNFARESVAVPEAAHFRLELDGANKATLAVFKGKCSATLPSAQFDVSEKHSATIKFAKNTLSNDGATDEASRNDTPNGGNKGEEAKASNDANDANDTFVIAKNYKSEPADAWDREQSEYHDRNASTASSARLSSPYSYGMSDLNYYGNFMNVPGYGSVWQPYLVGANWSPFQDGGWAFYPSVGYMWVSGYPWGWMPYRYGNWMFATGFGWVWQPGAWNSYYTMPTVVNAPVATKLPAPPTTGHQIVMVGRGLSTNPAEGTVRVLTISPGSAGYGVPRGSIDHLNHISRKVDRTSRPVMVSTAPPISTAPAPSTGFGGMAPINRAGAASPGVSSAGSHRPISTSSRPH
jgi:FecR protein